LQLIAVQRYTTQSSRLLMSTEFLPFLKVGKTLRLGRLP
jgi:hypothetical protein